MKNLGLIVVGVVIGLSVGFLADLEKGSEKILNGENATIYYLDKDNGFFDIAIEPKNNMKITTEAQMNINEYHDGAYLTGISESMLKNK